MERLRFYLSKKDPSIERVKVNQVQSDMDNPSSRAIRVESAYQAERGGD